MHLADQIILKGKTIGDRTTFTIWTEPEDKYRLKSLKGECWINPRKQIEALSLQSDPEPSADSEFLHLLRISEFLAPQVL